MPSVADRARETTTTTGTGSLTLAGAVVGYQTFASGLGAAGCLVEYAISHQTANEWEVGVGTFDGTTTLTRDTVSSSSNSNSAVNLSAGTKDVYVVIVAASIRTRGRSTNLAQRNVVN